MSDILNDMKKLLKISSFVTIVAGIVLVGGGAWGIVFTYTNVARENIVTTDDSSIPSVPVRGPLTLKVQADTIRKHTLGMTGGKTYAEMPRQIPKLDANGDPVLGGDGKPVMVANTARDIWITAMTLITALNLGVVTYAFFGLMLLLGFISLLTGIAFLALSRRY